MQQYKPGEREFEKIGSTFPADPPCPSVLLSSYSCQRTASSGPGWCLRAIRPIGMQGAPESLAVHSQRIEGQSLRFQTKMKQQCYV